MGTILERRGERVMFLAWDYERRRMLGGGEAWFVGVRLPGRRGLDPGQKTGDTGNYSASGWKVIEEGAGNG